MNKIKNVAELRAEIKKLEELSARQKEQIKSDVSNLKESFRPANLLAGIISELTGVNIDKKNFIRDGFAYTLSLIIQQFILKTEKKFEHTIYSFIDTVIDKIRNMVSSHTNPEAKRREREESNEERSSL
jgi:ribosome-associated translation inhibitor RaiA